MTIAFHWYTKETFTQDEAAKTLSDITINHTVTGLVISDGDGVVVDISDGHGRCEGWRVVLSGSHEHTMVAASGDTTYYLYLELAYSGDKVSAVTIEEYTGAQSTTDRIYLGTVVVTGTQTDLGAVTSLINTYAFESAKVRVSGDVTLADWRHGSDLTKIDGGDIYDGSVTNTKIVASAGIPYSKLTLTDSIVNTDVNSSAAIAYSKLNLSTSILNTDINGSAAIAWSKIAVDGNVTYDNVAETITSPWSIRGTRLNFHDGTVDCGDIIADGSYFVLRNGSDQNILTFANDGSDSTRLKAYGGSDIELITATGDIVLKNSGGTRFRVVGGTIWSDVVHYTHGIMAAEGCTYNIGSNTLRYATVFTDLALDVGNCDVAEWMPGESGKPGDVYILEDSGMLVQCTKDNDPQAIGIFTTDPGVIMGSQSHRFGMSDKDWRDFNVLVGVKGIVPIKVIGEVKPTDYLITSSTKGHARSITNDDKPPFFVLGRATTYPSTEDSKVMLFIEVQVLYHHPLGAS